MSNDASLLAAVERSPSLLFLADMCSWLTPIILVWPQWSARHLWNAVAGGCVPVLVGAYQVYMYVRRRVCVHAYVCMWPVAVCRCSSVPIRLWGCARSCTRMCVCRCARMFVRVYACMCARMYVCIYSCMLACMHRSMRACVCGCMYACMHASVCVGACMLCVRVSVCTHTHTHT